MSDMVLALVCGGAGFVVLVAAAAWSAEWFDVSHPNDDVWARHIFAPRLVARRVRWGGKR